MVLPQDPSTDLRPQRLLQNPKVGAILHAGQPSVQTLGIGDVLFGHTVPAGRMARAWGPILNF